MTRSRVRGMLLACGVSFGMFTGSALAIPAVLERLPDDAMLAIAFPSPDKLTKNLGDLSKAVGQEMPEMSVKDMLSMGGFSAGVDATKAIALVVIKPVDKPADKPAGKGEGKAPGAAGLDRDPAELAAALENRAIVLLPITSYEDMLTGFGVKPAGEGKVDVIAMPTGEDGFVKNIGGGYAAIGSDRALIESFTGKPGATAMKTLMGKAGEDLADASDVVTVINMSIMRPMAEEGLKEFAKQAKDQAAMMGQGAEAQIAVAQWMGETIIRDTRFVTAGVKLSGTGIGMDMVASFNDGSYLAKAVAGGDGNSGSLLSRLPAGPYLIAAALDTRAGGMRKFFSDVYAKSGAAVGDDAIVKANEKLYTEADGQAAVVGFPMGGAISGLLTATIGFTSAKDSTAAIKNIKDSVTVMDGKSMEGVKYTTTWADGGAKAGDKAVDVWDMKVSMEDAEQAGQMGAQAMQFIFGPQGGPGGYIAPADGGVYRTYAKSGDLMTKALGASKGDNLAGDAMIKDVQGRLPKGRVAEVYVSTKSVLDLVLPFAAMAGVPIGGDKIPEKLTPVGLSVSSVNGAAQMSVFVPADVIKTGVTLAEAFQQMQNEGGGDGMGEAPGEGKKSKEGGQPKF